MNKAVQLENETSSTQQLSENGFQEEETKNVSISFFIYRLIAYADARRSIAAFIFILTLVIICDNLFNNFFCYFCNCRVSWLADGTELISSCLEGC